ncbi:PGN_0703 family putative restriction endonuclease, partial [Gemmatimonas sp.]|uniref:PGN_0703 family putative restriction endonuclease n=1 Tax=Gemmatimonas sp. TaxID=1962908 RepID=UPI0038B33B60
MKTDETFVAGERQRAVRWKASTATLPQPARQAAPYVNNNGLGSGPAYGFCLPAEYAELTLLPEVRGQALALFAELGIPWHAGVGSGPGNHLLSSQVQCVNALGQMVHDPERIVASFGGVVNIESVLEIEPGRFLTFEYIGDSDYLNEARNGQRTRGAHCTSIDAAFVVRSTDGLTVLVLVEWKYTESYASRVAEPKDAVRWSRYS